MEWPVGNAAAETASFITHHRPFCT